MQVYDGGSEYIIYHLSKYLVDKENYQVLYVSDPTTSSSPTNLAFRAILADWAGNWDDEIYRDKTSAIARMGEKEFFFFCADCFNGTEDSIGSTSICTDESGKQNIDICKTEKMIVMELLIGVTVRKDLMDIFVKFAPWRVR